MGLKFVEIFKRKFFDAMGYLLDGGSNEKK